MSGLSVKNFASGEINHATSLRRSSTVLVAVDLDGTFIVGPSGAGDSARFKLSGLPPRAIEDGPSGAVTFCSGGASVISSGRQPRGSIANSIWSAPEGPS